MYNATTKQWELGGLNEANNAENGSTPTVSFFVQLNTYAAQIEAVYLPPSATSADTPTLPSWALALMGGLLFVVAIPAVTSERE